MNHHRAPALSRAPHWASQRPREARRAACCEGGRVRAEGRLLECPGPRPQPAVSSQQIYEGGCRRHSRGRPGRGAVSAVGGAAERVAGGTAGASPVLLPQAPFSFWISVFGKWPWSVGPCPVFPGRVGSGCAGEAPGRLCSLGSIRPEQLLHTCGHVAACQRLHRHACCLSVASAGSVPRARKGLTPEKVPPGFRQTRRPDSRSVCLPPTRPLTALRRRLRWQIQENTGLGFWP